MLERLQQALVDTLSRKMAAPTYKKPTEEQLARLTSLYRKEKGYSGKGGLANLPLELEGEILPRLVRALIAEARARGEM